GSRAPHSESTPRRCCWRPATPSRRWRSCSQTGPPPARRAPSMASRSGREAHRMASQAHMRGNADGDGAGGRELLKISELSERSGVSAGTIRYYLREGLLGEGEDILRTSRNMAYYPSDYVERIVLIKRLQEERFMPLRVI